MLGKKEKYPIVLIHGWGSSSIAFSLLKTLLEKKSYFVISFDLPGFGVQDQPSYPWTLADYTNFIIENLKQKKVKKFILIGHSFGGRLAAYIAAYYPKLVKSLILTGCPGPYRENFKIIFYRKLAKLGKIIFGLPILHNFQSNAKKVLYKVIGEYDYYNADEIMKKIFVALVKFDLEPIFRKIKTPTLLIWGADDKVVPLKQAYEIVQLISGSKLRIVKNAGHKLPYEKPDAFLKEINDFLF